MNELERVLKRLEYAWDKMDYNNKAWVECFLGWLKIYEKLCDARIY